MINRASPSSARAFGNMGSFIQFVWCRLAALAAVVVICWLGAGMLFAADIPLPDFTSYEVPDTQHPPAGDPLREAIDVVLLAAAIGTASYAALVRRSRAWLLALTAASVFWFGFVRKGCVCSIGAIQNVVLSVVDANYLLPWSVAAFFVLPLISTLFFGRTFCAAVCPLGAIQELAALRPIRVPRWVDHTLGLGGFIYLGMAVATTAAGGMMLICRYDPFVGFFRLSGEFPMLVFGGALLLVGVFVARPYCRFLCPLGAILGLLSRLAYWHIRIPPAECIRCRLCEDVCPYNAIERPAGALAGSERVMARRRLAWALAAVPLLVVVGFVVGAELRDAIGRLHPRVRLAERIAREEAGETLPPTDASTGFHASGESVASLYADAQRLRRIIGWASAGFGAWLGLIFGVKMVALCMRPRRDEYEPDRRGCVSCGRCFWYCPKEQVRLGLIDESQLPPTEPPPGESSVAAGSRASPTAC